VQSLHAILLQGTCNLSLPEAPRVGERRSRRSWWTGQRCSSGCWWGWSPGSTTTTKLPWVKLWRCCFKAPGQKPEAGWPERHRCALAGRHPFSEPKSIRGGTCMHAWHYGSIASWVHSFSMLWQISSSVETQRLG